VVFLVVDILKPYQFFGLPLGFDQGYDHNRLGVIEL